MITNIAPTEAMHAESRRRDRPAWVPTIAAFATIALCVSAGNWQHRRMLEKEALQQRVQHAATLSPVPLPDGVDDWTAWRFREIVATGEYDARRQILIDNKVHDGRVGFDVVTPFHLDDGRAMLVERGWIAGGPTRAQPPQASPPKGTITLRGRIDLPARDYYELGDRKAPAGPIWEHLDPARFAQASGIPVLPIVVEAVESPLDADLVRDWPQPDVGIERHIGYMVQWYTFAAMAAGLWLWFTFRRHRAHSKTSVAGPPQDANRARRAAARRRTPHACRERKPAAVGNVRKQGATSARNKRLLVLLAVIAFAPIALSYLAYYAWPRDARVNYGELLAPQTIAPIVGTRADGAPFDLASLRGRWVVLYAAPGNCSGSCADALYASRQARTIQNAERERVVRVWLVTDGSAPANALLAAHPDLTVAHADARSLRSLPQGSDRIYLVDPLGNFVLAWPSKPDIKAMARDLGRLLRASGIG